MTDTRRDLVEQTFPPIDLAEEPPDTAAAHPELKIETVRPGDAEGEPVGYGRIGRFHLIGSLADGEVFWDTRRPDEGDPLPRAIRVRYPDTLYGLALGLVGMKPGERRRLVVPPELALGREGDPVRDLPPAVTRDSLLLLDVEYVGPVKDLVVSVMKPGAGERLDYGMRGRFHYTGVLAKDGTVFDTSRKDAEGKPGEPREFDLVRGPSGVIEGWVLGLSGMREGEQRRLFVPAWLAYGDRGSPYPPRPGEPQRIGPGEDLVFEVELIAVVR